MKTTICITLDPETGHLEVTTSGSTVEVASMVARAAIDNIQVAEILHESAEFFELLDSEQSLGFENEIYEGGKELPN